MPVSSPRDAESAGRRSTVRPDSEFLKSLEDDSWWESDRAARPVRTRPPRREKRSRVVAVVALVVVAVVILIVGLAFGVGDSTSPGRGQSAPFELLPLEGTVETSAVGPAGEAAVDPASDGFGTLALAGGVVAI
jgi:hypothetical protein